MADRERKSSLDELDVRLQNEVAFLRKFRGAVNDIARAAAKAASTVVLAATT
jgi:hypothetical protein